MKEKIIYAIGAGQHDGYSLRYFADNKELAEKAIRVGGWWKSDKPRIVELILNAHKNEIISGLKLYLVHISKKTLRASYLSRIDISCDLSNGDVGEYIAIFCWAKDPVKARIIAKIKAKPFLNKNKKSNEI